MMTRPFSKQRNNSSSNHFSNTDAFIVPGVYARRHKLDFTVCHNKPKSSLSLAADTNVDADSALTVRIAAIHLCLNAGLIDIYEQFAYIMAKSTRRSEDIVLFKYEFFTIRKSLAHLYSV